MSKRAIIVLLVGVNLLLLATLILSTPSSSQAYAQAAPLAQNYLMVGGQIRRGQDALYVIDLATRRLHVFVTSRAQNDRKVFHAGVRDLQREFRGAVGK
ncbi:hypothetical protein RAS2_17290 [Phycisphaerae bacterium RAS2]|nr:hypothetical protein RAS2_17290 [Phycisphaerae bacterium RAS2]